MSDTAREILEDWLLDSGYTGLRNDESECICQAGHPTFMYCPAKNVDYGKCNAACDVKEDK